MHVSVNTRGSLMYIVLVYSSKVFQMITFFINSRTTRHCSLVVTFHPCKWDSTSMFKITYESFILYSKSMILLLHVLFLSAHLLYCDPWRYWLHSTTWTNLEHFTTIFKNTSLRHYRPNQVIVLKPKALHKYDTILGHRE